MYIAKWPQTKEAAKNTLAGPQLSAPSRGVGCQGRIVGYYDAIWCCSAKCRQQTMRRHKSTGVIVPALWRYWSKMGLLVLNPTNVPSPTQLYALTQWCHFLRDFASLFISGFQYHFQVLTIVVGGGDGTLSCKVEVLWWLWGRYKRSILFHACSCLVLIFSQSSVPCKWYLW